MKGLQDVEYLPEPDDLRILSVIDPSAVGFQDQWRAEVTGWAPRQAAPVPNMRRRKFLFANGALFSLVVIMMLYVWNSGVLFLELPPPKSEWAFEQSEFDDFSQLGFQKPSGIPDMDKMPILIK